MPSPLSVKVTPDGRAPACDSEAAGWPVVVTVNVPALPATNVVLSPLVIDGACATVRVKLCVASGLTPFDAVSVIG